MGASIHDVAARSGVSKSTVSRVLTLDRRVRPATRLRVQQAIRELGYRPNAVARGLVHGRTRTIGLVVFDLSNPFFGLLVRGVEAVARGRGYNVLVCDSGGDETQQQECLAMMAERRVDGILITPIDANDEELAAIRQAGMRAVLVNSTAGDERVSSVGTDNVRGGWLATQHLLELGHARVAFLGDSHAIPSCRERLSGYRMAHNRLGQPADPALLIEDLTTMEGVVSAVHGLLDLPAPPTAMVAVNDHVAIAALQAALTRGRRVPEDVALVGFDDIPVAAWLSVPLTTVAQSKEEQGAIAAALLLDQIENSTMPMQRVILQPRLVVRESCGASRVVEKGA
ncbi:MAG TPA: LacI family DNA-binding transcriptional regulator [Chloroflexota bacterium]|jgi:DNA-binding LacI/PurR family transcriptional regulator